MLAAKKFVWRGLIAAFVIFMAAVPALAGAFTTGPLLIVSGPSPFANCNIGAYDSSSYNYVNSEVEPRIAANPTFPNNLIGVFQQDRWNDGGAHGLATVVSFDGGKTWSETFAKFSKCSGGTAANGGDFDRASDPWVTFTPNGDAFQISLSFSADFLTSAVLVSRSSDGGSTWSEPKTLIRETSAFNFNDKESITADPTNPNYIYAVWDRSRKPGENASFNALHSWALRGDIYFSRSTDGGATWDTARSLMPRNSNLYTIGNQIVVLPNGTLVNIFAMTQGSGKQGSLNPFTESLMRSTDKGVTWSDITNISTEQAVPNLDPDTGAEIRASDGLPDATVDPNTGAIYVVWEDARFNGGAYNGIAFSMSTDGGLTWSSPVKINQTPAGSTAFIPTVRVAQDGTVGVSYYDFRNNTPAAGLPTDAWMVHCHTGCTNPANWSENHLSGPFDMETAPQAGGLFLGDYQGLTTVGNNFVPFFVQTNSGNTTNRTDVFTTTVGP